MRVDLLKYEIADWYHYNVKNPLRRIYKSIKSSYKWAKFGWNDRDYDYEHLFDAINFKLKNMLEYFRTSEILESDR
jgi:hypothetical protein